MIKKLCIGLALFVFGIRAEQILYLDEQRIQKTVAEIMISRGIALADEIEVLGTQLRKRALGCSELYRHNSSTETGSVPSEESIKRLYTLGFLYFWAGEAERACAVWSQIALCYPSDEYDEHLVHSAQDLLAQIQLGSRFAVMRAPVFNEPSDTSIVILLPLASTTILSAFLVG